MTKFRGRNRSGWFVLMPPAVMAIAAGVILGQAALSPSQAQPKQVDFDFMSFHYILIRASFLVIYGILYRY